jgi:hypothetical protein
MMVYKIIRLTSSPRSSIPTSPDFTSEKVIEPPASDNLRGKCHLRIIFFKDLLEILQLQQYTDEKTT